ncbi:hypothetical protein DLREEDagr8_39700 [Dongia sp. agr-C8]
MLNAAGSLAGRLRAQRSAPFRIADRVNPIDSIARKVRWEGATSIGIKTPTGRHAGCLASVCNPTPHKARPSYAWDDILRI